MDPGAQRERRGCGDARDAVTGRGRAGRSRPRREGARGEVGPRGAGPEGMGKKRRWAGLREWLGWVGVGFSFLYLFSYFKYYSNLIEFKYKFEFNPSTQTNKRDAPA